MKDAGLGIHDAAKKLFLKYALALKTLNKQTKKDNMNALPLYFPQCDINVRTSLGMW